MNRDYSVFLSHAGPDKESIAIPLYERLRERNIHAFLDRKELYPGDNGLCVMEYAMNTALVGVFILRPEFAARNWTMAELMCFQRRERDALKDRRPLPILISVFYRLHVHTCRKTTLLDFFDSRKCRNCSSGKRNRENRGVQGVVKRPLGYRETSDGCHT